MGNFRTTYRASGRQKAQQGATLIEFILLLGLFFLLVAGVVDLASLMRVSYNLSEASRHGARSAAALWGALPGCPAATPETRRCNDVAAISDPTVRLVAEATCTYLELAGLQRDDWNFSFLTYDRAWSGRNGTSGAPLRVGRVQVDQAGARQCLFCWQTVLATLNLSARSTFSLQGGDCLTVS